MLLGDKIQHKLNFPEELLDLQVGKDGKIPLIKTIRYIGVQKMSPSSRQKEERWFADIMLDGVKYHIGSYASEIEAAFAYDEVAGMVRMWMYEDKKQKRSHLISSRLILSN